MITITEHLSPKGVKVIHHLSENARVFHMGIMINAGSRDEEGKQRGVAHFLEHALFKGTTNKSALKILSVLDEVGGELNAYTTKEETVVYASALNKFQSKAIDVLFDIVLHSKFPKRELEKEKEVVIDEINSYQDSPYELIFEEFEELLLGKHPVAKTILGKRKDVLKIKKKTLTKFVQKHYHVNNLVFFYSGAESPEEVLKRVDAEVVTEARSKNENKNNDLAQKKTFNKTIKKDVHQSHVAIGAVTCGFDNKDRLPLVLLNNYLGGPALNSRLSMELREKMGIAYHVESSFNAYKDLGVFQIYFGTDPKNIEKALKVIDEELEKLCEKKLSGKNLTQIKEQFKGQVALGVESRLNLLLSFAKSGLRGEPLETVEQSFEKIDQVSAADIQKVANKYLTKKLRSQLIYKPK